MYNIIAESAYCIFSFVQVTKYLFEWFCYLGYKSQQQNDPPYIV